MKVALINIKKPGDNKEFNGGFGTTFNTGRSSRAKLLSFVRRNLENIPTMSYAYISAILKKYNHEVNYYENEIPKSKDYDLALIHVSMIRHNEEKDLLRTLKKNKGKNNFIGIYGPLATVCPELFKESDIILVGEPEEAIIKIARSGKLKKGLIKSNPLSDLDELPFPDWSLFHFQNYSLSPLINLRPAVFVHASRGCPYSCSYCPYMVFGNYRKRKPEKVVEELRYLKKHYKIKAFYFRDPTFSLGRERIEKLANLMIEEKLGLFWGCETRSDLLDIQLLELLYRSGLRAIKIGIESIDRNLLKKHGRKPIKIEHQENIIRFCKKKGIKIVAFYIIGLPSDTKESIKKTLNYSKKLNTSFANFTICTPIPGTPFYEKMKPKIFEKNLNKFDNFHVVFKNNNLSSDEIYSLQEKAITGYFFRPSYFFRYILDKIKEKYEF